MTRTEARRLWQRIANGELEREQYDDPVDLHAWIRGVAERLLEADTVRDAVRPGTVLAAVQLCGKHDENAQLRETLQLIDEFSFIDAGGVERPGRRGERMAMLVNAARASGLLTDDPSDDELRKRINRML